MIDLLFVPLALVYAFGVFLIFVLLQKGNGNQGCVMSQGEIVYCSILWPLFLGYILTDED